MGRLTVLHKSLKWDRHPNIIGPNSQENDQLNEYGLNTWGQSGNIRQMETELLLFPREMLFHAQEVWNLLSFSSSTRCCNFERACPPSRWVPYCWFSCHFASSCGCKCCSVRMNWKPRKYHYKCLSLTRKGIAGLRYFTSPHPNAHHPCCSSVCHHSPACSRKAWPPLNDFFSWFSWYFTISWELIWYYTIFSNEKLFQKLAWNSWNVHKIHIKLLLDAFNA